MAAARFVSFFLFQKEKSLMPKTKLQKIVFTALMVFCMVYCMTVLHHRAETGRLIRARILAGTPGNVGRVCSGLPADLLLHHAAGAKACAADHPTWDAAAHLFHAGDPMLHGLLDRALRHSIRHLLSRRLHCRLVPPIAAAGVRVLPCRALLAGLLHRSSGPAALSDAVPAAACRAGIKNGPHRA